MKKLFITLALAGIFSLVAQAQYLTAFNNLTAYQTSGNQDVESLKKAQEAIDNAVKDEKAGAQGKTWYYRGLIYQFIFENPNVSPSFPNALITASESYQKAFNVGDTKFRQEKEATQNLITASVQIYNKGIDHFQNANYKDALTHFLEVANIRSFFEGRGIQNNVDDDNALFNAALAALKLNNNA